MSKEADIARVLGSRFKIVRLYSNDEFLLFEYLGSKSPKSLQSEVARRLDINRIDFKEVEVKDDANERYGLDSALCVIIEAPMGTKFASSRVASELLAVAKELERLGGIYSIEPGGLRELKTTGVTLEDGAVYAMGASSSPDLIFITKANGDHVWYMQYPFKREAIIDRVVAEDLIQTGSKRWISTYGHFHPELAQSMKSGLRGGPIKKQKLSDFQRFRVYARPVSGDENSLWRAAEQYGGVSWNSQDGWFEIEMSGKSLEEIKHDRDFEIVKVVPR